MWSTERTPLRSIRGRLIIALIVGLGSLLAVLFVSLDLAIDRHLYTDLDARLLDRARTLAALLGSEQRADALLSDFRSRDPGDWYAIWDERGTVLLRSAPGTERALAAPPSVPAAQPVFYDVTLPDGHRGRAIARRAALSRDAGQRPVVIALAAGRQDIDALERYLHHSLGAGIVLATLGAAALATLVVNHSLRPLLRLGAQVARLSPEQPHAPLLDRAMPTELAPLAETLDQAFRRLYAAIDRERRFARDVAHELRTPLAEIRAIVELAQRSGDPARSAGALRISLAAAERLQRSVDGLLALARYESGQATPQPEPLEIGALLDAQRAAMTHACAARAIRIDGAHAPDWWTQSDPILLERVLTNLLLNATEYAPTGSRIACALTVDGPAAWIEVRNPAPDLTADDVPHLGERFWRKHPEHDPTVHGGLGLALACTMARMLQLDLRFRLDAGELVARLGPFAPLPDHSGQDRAS